MTAPIAFTGTFSEIVAVKTRSIVKVIIECPIEQAGEIIAAFGFPQPGREVAVAVARLVTAPKLVEKPKRTWDELSCAEQAGIRCNEMAFQNFLSERSENIPVDKDVAANLVRLACGVHSRADIKPGSKAAEKWHDMEIDYQNWLRSGWEVA